MNHIDNLTYQMAQATAAREALEHELRALLGHLDSPKFQGTDPDGSRRDWIATADVRRRIVDAFHAGVDAAEAVPAPSTIILS